VSKRCSKIAICYWLEGINRVSCVWTSEVFKTIKFDLKIVDRTGSIWASEILKTVSGTKIRFELNICDITGCICAREM
jgi:hypothetical protein